MDSSNRISAIIPQRKCDTSNTKFNTRNEMNMHAQFFDSRKKPALSNTNIMNLKTAKKITCLFCLMFQDWGFISKSMICRYFSKALIGFLQVFQFFISLNSLVGAEGLPVILETSENKGT